MTLEFVVIAVLAVFLISCAMLSPETSSDSIYRNRGRCDEEREQEQEETKRKELPETAIERFSRENTMEKCIERGGFLTTGERMEAKFGACEEAARCFPEDYYG